MRKMFLGAAAAIAMLVATPAMADEVFAVTPSGGPEAVFDAPAQEVIAALTSHCMDSQWQVVAATEMQLTCEAPLNATQSVLGQVLMGNSYSTAPRRFMRFNVVHINGVTRVQASGWVELQMAFGQTRQQALSGASFHNGMMGWLMAGGGRFPPGTTFPNHAALGLLGDLEPQGDGYAGLRVTEIREGSAAAAAGVQVGDVITRIAGKRFHHDEDYLDATAKAAERSTYRVQLLRSGREVSVDVARAFRPAAGADLRRAGR